MKFAVSSDNQGAVIQINPRTEGDLCYWDLQVQFPEPIIPKKITLDAKMPLVDCYSVWSPSIREGRTLNGTWRKRKTDARLASWMPVHQLLSRSGRNRLCLALSDCTIPTSIATGVCEEDGCVDILVEFFTIPTSPITCYEATLRVDQRDIPYYDSLYEVTQWWESDCGYVPASVPEAARLPMDSLWYSFHQILDKDEIIKECALSKALGMETVIIDDGWQTDDNNRGYAYCGDWQVAERKMGDMLELCNKIHDLDMKVMLWFSVPFMGIHAKRYDEFSTMLLEHTGDSRTFWSMDPRYPEVREYLIETFERAVREWNLDGLKLDFIDHFSLKGKSLEPDSRRDYVSLEDGIDVLMKEIVRRLREIKEDILIEFRQTYVGPAIRQYGNILRVGDCPADMIKNRQDTINLRLTSGKTAVHSDMLMWHVEDTVESAALQLISALYSVPQISMRIDELSDDHKKMLAYYLDFWKAYREVLLDGKLVASTPEDNYSQVSSILNDVAVVTAYNEAVIVRMANSIVAVNATGKERLIFDGCDGMTYRVVDCCGQEVSQGHITCDLQTVKVPLSGMVFVETNQA